MARKASRRGRRSALKPDYANSWAVVVGINDYAEFPKLTGAVKDAEGIAELLVTALDFPRENVLCILDPPSRKRGRPFTIVDTEGSKGAIEKLLFTDLPKRAKRNDRVVVFFAGHGLDRRSPGGRRLGYLVPAPSRRGSWHEYVRMDHLVEESQNCAAKHMFYLLDACFGGLAITRAAGGASRYEADMLTSTARQVLAAGTGKQEVVDWGPGGHSPFTHAVLEGLRGSADLNRDGFITGDELMFYVKSQVALDKRTRQTPVFGNLPGHEAGGDFVFRGLAASAEARVRRALPAEGGDSIAHVAATAGTLGCLVRSGETLYVLSASDVLDPDGKAKRGDHIVQPGPFDAGSANRDVIATFDRSAPKAGAAIARVLNSRLVRDTIRSIGRLRGVTEPTRGMKLRLFGRTSGLARASIRAVNVSARVLGGSGKVDRIRGLFETEGVISGGDSGAVAVDEKNRAIGLAFAGSDEKSFFVPMTTVLKALGVTLVCGADQGLEE